MMKVAHRPYIFKNGDMNLDIAMCPNIFGFVKHLKLHKKPCNKS
jgi:hypothetical protein